MSRPAVSEMIHRMEDQGLVTVDGSIRLTDDGLSLAESVVRRHRLAERFLTDMLGLSWADAHTEAGKWEHVISDPVEAALVRVLGEPTTCPHGNPIPGSNYDAPDAVPLDGLSVGDHFKVSRIPEELEFAPGLLEFLEQSHLVPGSRGKVTSASPDGTRTVEVDGPARRHRHLRQHPHPRHDLLTPSVRSHPGVDPCRSVRSALDARRADYSCSASGSWRAWIDGQPLGGPGQRDVERPQALRLLLDDGGRLDHHRRVELESLDQPDGDDGDLRVEAVAGGPAELDARPR